MSSRNLEAVEEAFAAYDRGDMDRVADFADPEVVVSQLEDLPDAETFHGRRGLLEVIDEWQSAWDDVRVERLTTREVGEHVVTTVRQRARGRRSGVEVEGVFTFVFTLRAGRLRRWRMFVDEAQALEAVARTASRTAIGREAPLG
jgi:ketosteroid isomerase-like protein